MNRNNHKPLVHELLEAIARRLTASPAIPPENREAFAAVAPRLIEETIRSVLGCDTVQLTGWVIAPSERQARRERILAAIVAGEAAGVIASRELVSVRWVEKLRARAQ